MPDDVEETDKLHGHGETVQAVKYKDQHTCQCSKRWEICAYVFSSFTLLYMHRVNLSLAVVCMVDTTETFTISAHSNNSEIETNYSDNQTVNGSEHGGLFIRKNLTSSNTNYHFLNEHVIYNVRNETGLSVGNTETETITRCGSVNSQVKKEWIPELQWKKSEISLLLSSYFYGSFFTQIPAGTVADIFGGKHIITVALLVTTVCSLLTPICARTSIILLFVIRVVIGLAGGMVIPAGMSMAIAWSTPNERPLMIAVIASGLLSGTVITYLSSGFLCAYGFDNGWPSIFYIHGCITALFTFLWFLKVYSRPSQHPFISKRELEHIQNSKNQTDKVKRSKTPWRSLMLSKALWAAFIAHFCFNWSFITVLINVPLFLKEVLKYDVKSNGSYSAVPFVFQIVSSLFSGKLSVIIIKRQILGHLATRRIFTSISLLGIALCLICAGYVSCEVRHVGVILLCLSCTFGGVSYGGFFANHAEFAGQFAGTAFGITNAGGVISSILASMMAGFLTPNGLQEEWQHVLYIAAGVNVIGATAFVLCSDVYLQPWARNQEVISIEVGSMGEPQETKKFNKENIQSDTIVELKEIKQLDSENISDIAQEIEERTPLNKEEEFKIHKTVEIEETRQLNGSSIS